MGDLPYWVTCHIKMCEIVTRGEGGGEGNFHQEGMNALSHPFYQNNPYPLLHDIRSP